MLKDAFWSEKYVKGDNGLPKSLYNQERIIKSFRGKKKIWLLDYKMHIAKVPFSFRVVNAYVPRTHSLLLYI